MPFQGAARAVHDLVVGDAEVRDDPFLDMARRDPTTAAWFIKATMLLGSITCAVASTVSIVMLFVHWHVWGDCERPLRWWLLLNCVLQSVQVPLRLGFFTSVRAAEAARRDVSRVIAGLARTAAWRISRLVSLLTYFWLILGVVWVINAGSCSDSPHLFGTTVGMLALSAGRVLSAFTGLHLLFTEDDAASDAPKMVAAEPAQIRALGVVVFKADSREGDAQPRPTCAVCLAEYLTGEELRELPCGHRFHLLCADRWLLKSKRCPLCMRAIDEADFRACCPCFRQRRYHGHSD